MIRITKRLSSISCSKLLNHSLEYHLPSSDTVVKKEIKNEIELVKKAGDIPNLILLITLHCANRLYLPHKHSEISKAQSVTITNS